MQLRFRYLAIAVAFLVGCTSESTGPELDGASADSVVRRLDCSSLGTDDTLPQQGEPCPDRVCAESLTCVEYYGIAGPSGPLFTSCEIRCDDKGRCPCGQACITIADGPGQVCRPRLDDDDQP
jgi:hypothetical protein